nr:MAG: DNA pilot protein [Microvirus sp.]
MGLWDGLATGLTGGILGAMGQSSANTAASNMQDKQMHFQAEQSNTAYQRATKDMQAAGINPMLAYMQGGASASPGAGADQGNVGAAATSGAASALAAKQASAAADQQEAAAEKTDEEAKGVKIDNQNKPEMLKIAKIHAAASALQSEKAGTNTIYNSLKQGIRDLRESLGTHSSGKSIINSPPPTGAKKDY